MDIKKAVQNRYGKLISSVNCCDTGCGSCSGEGIPSFGVGKPVSHALLSEGEKVLDIGSGAGGDCIKAALAVGESGEVTGLDMTEKMLHSAMQNASDAGVSNIRFVQGDAEEMPLDDSTFDVVISDCVINLVPDKGRVFQEIHRVLKPGGRMVISDVVTDRPFSAATQSNMDLWCSCVSGALPEDEYVELIRRAGLSDPETLDRSSAGVTDGNQLFHVTYRATKE